MNSTDVIRSRSYQTFFLCKRRIFWFFDNKLGHFLADAFFPCVTSTQAYQQKSENRKNKSLVGLTPGCNCSAILSTPKYSMNIFVLNTA